jgi:nitroreductase
MNETIRSLLARRSIRRFKPEQIRDDELEAVLQAGMYAPSGANRQSARFIVVQDPDTRALLSRMNREVRPSDDDPYYGAPTIVLVLADRTTTTPVEDGALALGNMFNAASSLGLGSCWVHRERQMFDSDEGRALLATWGVVGDYVGVGACILGYPDGEHPEPAPRKPDFVTMVR